MESSYEDDGLSNHQHLNLSSHPSCAPCNTQNISYSSQYSPSISFYSNQCPLGLYTPLKKLAIQLLTCEVTHGGVVALGRGRDEDVFQLKNPGQDWSIDWNLSYLFRLRDIQARGQKSTWGILFLTDDDPYIFLGRDLLQRNIQDIVDQIQHRSNMLYETESKTRSAMSPVRSPSTSTSTSTFNLNSSPVSRNMPAHLKMSPQKLEKPSPRSLSQLSRCKDVYGWLHQRFAMAMFSVGTSLGTRDLLPQRHHQFKISQSISGRFKLSRSQQKGTMTLGQLWEILGAFCIKGLLYNVIIGNQIIIRGNFKKLGRVMTAIMNALTRILPKIFESADPVTSEVYKEGYETSLLILDDASDVPEYVNSATYAKVDILMDTPSDPAAETSDHGYLFLYMGAETTKTCLGTELKKMCNMHLSLKSEFLKMRCLQQDWVT
eukprot:TRINITY_DN426_c1_g1_i2.p1 TRINITY_DN426_c1_g1~~TRINITY_DN426_c1_g1_i2.p1  ORF type:complete len:484 (-),score=127.51 TRINITY_DN426_c1_g1_i2:177-1475(-)